MSFKNRITNIQPGPAASTTVTVTLGTGRNAPTLDKLQFALSGGTFTTANISEVRGFIGGREFYKEGTGTVHNARRTYLGLGPKTSELAIDFGEPNAKSGIEQYLSCLPLSLMDSCYFEVDINSGAVTPALKVLATIRGATKNPFIKKFRKTTHGFSNTGEQVIQVPNGPNGGKLLRAWIHEATPANITAVELRARNAIAIEGTRAEIQNDQEAWGLTPQTGVLVLDMIPDGNLNGLFDTEGLADVQLKLTGTAADTYTIYWEYLDPIGRL